MIEQLELAQQTALAELEKVTTLDALRAWKSAYLAKAGPLAEISRGMGKLSAEERPRVGQRINATKQALQSAYDALEQR